MARPMARKRGCLCPLAQVTSCKRHTLKETVSRHKTDTDMTDTALHFTVRDCTIYETDFKVDRSQSVGTSS